MDYLLSNLNLTAFPVYQNCVKGEEHYLENYDARCREWYIHTIND